MSAIALSIASGVIISAEILVYKHLVSKYDDINPDMVMWIYRLGSMFFISLFLMWEINRRDPEYDEKAIQTLHMRRNFWWFVLLSALSGVGIVLFFRAVSISKKTGSVTAVRSIYIPLTFVGALIFINHDWRDVKGMTWLGITLMCIAIGILIVYP